MENSPLTLAYIKGYCDANGILLPKLEGTELINYCKKDLNIPKLHCFKNINDPFLMRVKKLIGFMKTLYVKKVVDFGTQRGALLWPLMNAFPHVLYTAIDIDPDVVKYLSCVRAGGAKNLTILDSDITGHIPLLTSSADVVVVSEILEHLIHPEQAAHEAIRIASQYIFITVPSKPDDNPEHLQLFTKDSLVKIFKDPKVSSINVSYLPNSIVAIAEIKKN